MRERLEYALVWPAIKLMGLLPRPVARAIGIGIGLTVFRLHRRLRDVGMRNLALAFPGMSETERHRILRGEYISLG
ncbi:MAG: lipid A biosynthesis acyltransferase, partial [Terriglobales bacterium]